MAEKCRTDKNYWIKYWSNFKPEKIKEKYFFTDLLEDFPKSGSKFIEIGGFPGTFSAYFKKYYNYDTTLLDYYIVPEVVRKVESVNYIDEKSIKLIEENFLEYNTKDKYDIVFSAGFIEHFEDTKYVIKKHYDLLGKGGILFISMPNFKGLNGLIQLIFDKNNYDAHNIKSMDVKYLSDICHSLNMENFEVFYHGVPCLWLEKSAHVNKYIRYSIVIFSILMSIIRLRNKFLSPFIIIKAKKENK